MSPRATARITGFLYVVIIATAALSEFYIRGGLVVSGNAARTAANILASEPVYRLSGAIDFIVLFCDISIALLLYILLRPVSDGLSLLAAFFRLVFSAIMAVAILFHFAPLFLLKGASYLDAFSVGQLQALSMLSLKLHSAMYDIGLLFFGVHCVLIGLLIARSAFLPKIIGVLLALAGLGYLVSSTASLFLPALAPLVFPYSLLPGLVAESVLALWLLLIGVNASKWEQQAKPAA